MSGLINLLSEYSSRLAILPILALMNVILTVIIHFINSKKILKFLPSLIIGAVALAIGVYSITIFNRPMGLNMAWIAVFLGSTSLVGICSCFIIDLLVSIRTYMGFEPKSSVNKPINHRSFQKTFKAKRKRAKDEKND